MIQKHLLILELPLTSFTIEIKIQGWKIEQTIGNIELITLIPHNVFI